MTNFGSELMEGEKNTRKCAEGREKATDLFMKTLT